jgi:hypothetical protein
MDVNEGANKDILKWKLVFVKLTKLALIEFQLRVKRCLGDQILF